MSRLPSLHAVAIAGGSGTRFWPLSRQTHPKQLLNLSGEDTLLHATLARMAPLVAPERWWMVVGQSHAAGCRDIVPEVVADQVLVEPRGRNTAPAIALAALHVMHQDPDGVMAVLPADHHIGDGDAFRAAIALAHAGAAEGRIMTLGLTPTHPETGFGYIECGERLVSGGAFCIKRFVEKPNLATARALVAEGTYLWNAGLFIMQAKRYWRAVQSHLPALAEALAPVAASIGQQAYQTRLEAAFAAIEGVSIDYGIMEHVTGSGVVPVQCGWSDVGSWRALGSVVPADQAGNIVRGQAALLDCSNCTAYASEGHVVAMVGLKGIVAVHTPDATLVLPAERSQDVREVLAVLKERGWQQFL